MVDCLLVDYDLLIKKRKLNWTGLLDINLKNVKIFKWIMCAICHTQVKLILKLFTI